MKLAGNNGTGSVSIDDESLAKGDYRIIVRAVFTAFAAFAAGRAQIASLFFPCGTAIMSAALKKDTINLYLLFPLLFSFLSLHAEYPGNIYLAGDFFSMLLCTVVFGLSSRRKISDFYRMIFSSVSSVSCVTACMAAAGELYRFSVKDMAFEAVTVCILYYIFHVFFDFTGKGDVYSGSAEKGIVALATVWVLAFSGALSGIAGQETASAVTCSAALFVILETGYKLGTYAGTAAGAASAVILYLCGSIYSSQTVIFVLAGLTAGFFKGLNRYTSAVCFSAVVLVFRLTCAGSMGSFPIWPPVVSALIFVLLPHRFSVAVTGVFKRLVHDDTDVVDIRTGDVLDVLSGCRECFSGLARLYSTGKDRSGMISYQFRGMEQVVEKLEKDVKAASHGRLIRENAMEAARYMIEAAASGCAKYGSVSGDSYIYRKIKGGKYIMILCDGMGNGERASIESTFAVQTLAGLIEAGFDTEIALHTVNSILLLRSEDEIFSTVDIGIFDCVSGKLRLYKIGAASTYIKHGENVKAVKSAALPMGIVDGLRIDYVSVKLQDGDQIIMMSDGITDSGRYIEDEESRAVWPAGVIASIRSKDPGTMADLIMNRAIENYGVRERDDLTVISAAVKSVQ